MVRFSLRHIHHFLPHPMTVEEMEKILAKQSVEVNSYNDEEIDLSLPHNRIDLYSHYGIARILTSSYNRTPFPSRYAKLDATNQGTMLLWHCAKYKYTTDPQLEEGLSSHSQDPWRNWCDHIKRLYGIRTAIIRTSRTIDALLTSKAESITSVDDLPKSFYICFYGSYVTQSEVDPNAFRHLASTYKNKIMELGIEVVQESAYTRLEYNDDIPLSLKRICSYISPTITESHVIKLLLKQGYDISVSHKAARVPRFRHDIQCLQDIVEDVLQGTSYNDLYYQANIPCLIPQKPTDIVSALAKVLSSKGLHESKSLPFTSTQGQYSVINPVNNIDKHLRTNLVDGLCEQVNFNRSYKQRKVSLFEIGTVFAQEQDAIHVGIVMYEKGIAPEYLLRLILGIVKPYIKDNVTVSYTQDGINLTYNEVVIGFMRTRDCIAYCDINTKHMQYRSNVVVEEPSNLPEVTRDITVCIKDNMSYYHIDNVISLDERVKCIDLIDICSERNAYTLRLSFGSVFSSDISVKEQLDKAMLDLKTLLHEKLGVNVI